jgi:hypothetical protein
MSRNFWLISACAILFGAVSIGKPVIASEPTSSFFPFAPRTYGPIKEPCITTGRQVRTGDDWEAVIESAASGTVLLFRAGTYGKTTANIRIPDGVTLKPYNCETVVFDLAYNTNEGDVISPGSNTVIAGLEFRSTTHLRMLRPLGVTNVTIRNNNLYGGRGDFYGHGNNCSKITIQGNNIRSGPAASNGGNIFNFPNYNGGCSNVAILDNDIRGDWFGDVQTGDDGIAVSGCTNCRVEGNLFRNIYNVEELLDVKNYHVSPFIFRRNRFIGPFLGTRGGADGGITSGGTCVIIGMNIADNLLGQAINIIEDNMFSNCYYAASTSKKGVLAVGSSRKKGEVIFRGNVVTGEAATEPAATRINMTKQSKIYNNTFVKSGFRLMSCGAVEFKNNIFYETVINDTTDACSPASYFATYNVFYKVVGSFERGVQKSNKNADPLFVDLAGKDIRLKVGSPAIAAGEGGVDIGALLGSLSSTPVATSTTPAVPSEVRVQVSQ